MSCALVSRMQPNNLSRRGARAAWRPPGTASAAWTRAPSPYFSIGPASGRGTRARARPAEWRGGEQSGVALCGIGPPRRGPGARSARDRRAEGAPQALDTLGWVHHLAGRSDDAIRAFRQTLDKQPENPTYHYHLGAAYFRAG